MSDEHLARTLRDEASRTATRLGHRMTDWVAVRSELGVFAARCADCDDSATVAVRRFTRAPVGGPAVHLRCKKKR